ncbi:sterile alpha motif [Desmophyllum pertusum]|uniref:Sterile alpha motif n=1 Tax=Desmophyllum pertusum TaxID=174260 RepID=A0A9X0DCL9_9CNID|nr:sterile alpha motif [Desmophyllum pertusum]
MENSAITIKKGLLQQKACGKTQKKKSDDENETASTQQGHDEQLKKEMAARKPDDKKIFALLKVSLQTRRKWIDGLAGKGTVKKVLKEYPGFRNYKQVMMENCLLTRCSQYKEAWRKQIPQMWEFACRDCPDLLEDCPEEGMEAMDDDDKTAIICMSLPRAWGIKERLVHYIKDNINFEAFIKKLNSDCHLVAANDEDFPQLFVIIDNEVVVKTDLHMDGLFSFFAVFQVFNLEYPQKLKLCFKFLEEYIFGIPQSRRPLAYTKGIDKLLA